MDAGLQAGARGWVPGAVAECRGGWVSGAGCWVLMAGAEALAGAQWRVRIPGAVGGADIGCCWLGAEALTGAQCRVRIPGAGCCQKVLDRTMRLVKDFDYLCSPSSEGVSAP